MTHTMTNSNSPQRNQPLNGDSADVADLPLEGAFIVEFRLDAADSPADRLGGRIEHVASGAATRFASAHELLSFVRSVLRSCDHSHADEDYTDPEED